MTLLEEIALSPRGLLAMTLLKNFSLRAKHYQFLKLLEP
jgi:hypothetical protein